MNINFTTTMERLLPDFGGQIYHGNLKLFGADHHMQLIRVKEGNLVEPLDGAHEVVKKWGSN